VPSFALGSAALPASNTTDMRTVGTVVRLANSTWMPFDSVVRSIAGKVRSLIASTAGGAERSTAWSGLIVIEMPGAAAPSAYLGLR